MTRFVLYFALAPLLIGTHQDAFADGQLSGGMARLAGLVGAPWQCGTPPGTVITFEPAANNTLHEYETSAQVALDAYFDYSPTLHAWFRTWASQEFYGFQVSTDGISFSGTGHAGVSRTYPDAIKYNLIGLNELNIHEEIVATGVTKASDVTCVR